MSWLSLLPGTAAWRRRREHRLCQEALDRVQELVDGEVQDQHGRILLSHLEACRPCQVEAEAVREIKRAISRIGCDADPDTVARLREWAWRLPDEQSPTQ